MKIGDVILRIFMMLPHRFGSIIPFDNSSFIAGQRYYVFFYSTLLIGLGIAANLIGLKGPDHVLSWWLNIADLVICITTFILYCLKKIKVTESLVLIIMAACVETAAEMVLCSMTPSSYNIILCLVNIVIPVLLITLATIAYIPFLPTVLGFMAIIAYTASTIISKNEALADFYLLFLMAYLIICTLSECIIRQSMTLLRDNARLRADEYELLSLLKIKKQQVKAFAEFSHVKNPSTKDTERLLSLLSDGMRRNLINGIIDYLREKEYDIETLRAAMPQLSPSELKICLLILQDKKLGEICRILDKTENNVSAHRSHIRSKLEVQTGENLKAALEKRVELFRRR